MTIAEVFHSDYSRMKDEWSMVRACVSGPVAVKDLGIRLLPPPDLKEGVCDVDRYGRYKGRAIYTNYTGRTSSGLVGAAMRKDPTIELDPLLEFLNENADGAGLTLSRLSKKSLSEVVQQGRETLLIDYPEIDKTLTAEEQNQIKPQAFIRRYQALDFINWKTRIISGREVLTLAVLREKYDQSENDFTYTEGIQHRILRLEELEGFNGLVYTQEVQISPILDASNQQKPKEGDQQSIKYVPRQSDGNPFSEIPLVCIGSDSNDFDVDYIPISDIAHVNIGHYKNSADLEENNFLHGQLTIGVHSSMDGDEFLKLNPNGINVGAHSAHFLGENGGFTSVQADPSQLGDVLMKRKEEQMRAIGAKMVEDRDGQNTATGRRIDATGENSVLGDLVSNVETAYRKVIEFCAMFMGSTGENIFEMNREFFPDNVDPQLIMAAIQLNDRGVIAKQDLRSLSRKADVVKHNRTDEEIEKDVSQESPLVGPGLGGPNNQSQEAN